MSEIINAFIPKIIHYCWFGRNEKPEIVKKCITSWRKYLPDWEIVEWNESNYNIEKNPFIYEAYKCKRWAFVSDYVRFDVLYKYGGIYLDTDVELLKNIPQIILNQKAFTGVESTNEVAPGLIFGCIPQFGFLKNITNIYENMLYADKIPVTVNKYITRLLQQDGFVLNGCYQIIDEIAIYPAEYFCGYDLDVNEFYITNKTISVHHYISSWMPKRMLIERKIHNTIKKLIGIKNYKKLIRWKRMNLCNVKDTEDPFLHKDIKVMSNKRIDTK